MITELTGLDMANASLLDESSAAAEALAMSYAIHNEKRKKFFLSKNIFPQSIEVIKTRAHGLDIELVIDEIPNFNWEKAEEYCGFLVQNPDNFGNFADLSEMINKLHESNVIVSIVADILSLTLFKTPGEMGADIAVGSV